MLSHRERMCACMHYHRNTQLTWIINIELSTSPEKCITPQSIHLIHSQKPKIANLLHTDIKSLQIKKKKNPLARKWFANLEQFVEGY